MNNNESHRLNVDPATPADKKSFLYIRMIVPTLLSFITVFITVLLTDPVPSEGWLRSLFVIISSISSITFCFAVYC